MKYFLLVHLIDRYLTFMRGKSYLGCAEGVGIEPTRPGQVAVYKAAALTSSATLPVKRCYGILSTLLIHPSFLEGPPSFIVFR